MGCSPSGGSGPEPDTDGDGLSDAEELNVTGTSPILPDTDGDGYTDYDEVVKFGFDPQNNPTRFNPRVADVPQMAVVFTGPPVVRISYTDARGVTQTIDNSIAESGTVGVTNSMTNTNTRSDTLTESTTVTNEVAREVMNQVMTTVPLGSGSSSGGASSPPTDGGSGARDAAPRIVDSGRAIDARTDGPREAETGGEAEAEAAVSDAAAAASSGATRTVTSGTTVTLTNSVSNTVSPSTTFDTSIAFTNEQMLQNSELLTRTESLARDQTVTAINSLFAMPTIIQNRSHIAFRVTNVELGTYIVDGLGNRIPGPNLVVDVGTFSGIVPFDLAPGEQTGHLSFVSNPVTLETTELVLRSGHLFVELSVYEIDDPSGKAFSFVLTDIEAKTAVLAIDYGRQRPPEIYEVATNLDPAHPGITASKALRDILWIPYEADKDTGLTTIRDVGIQASGGAHWAVSRLHNEGPDVVNTPFGAMGEPYDFDGIELRAGDVLHIAYLGPSAPWPSDVEPGGPPLGVGPPTTDGGLPVTGGTDSGGAPWPQPSGDGSVPLPQPMDDAGAWPRPPSPAGPQQSGALN
jgi:hypothetical protein